MPKPRRIYIWLKYRYVIVVNYLNYEQKNVFFVFLKGQLTSQIDFHCSLNQFWEIAVHLLWTSSNNWLKITQQKTFKRLSFDLLQFWISKFINRIHYNCSNNTRESFIEKSPRPNTHRCYKIVKIYKVLDSIYFYQNKDDRKDNYILSNNPNR